MEKLEQRVQALESKLECIDQKMDSVLELIAVGKGAALAAKWVSGIAAFGVSMLELWRTFIHKG